MPELPEVETIRQQLSRELPFKILKVKRSKVSSSIIHTPMSRLEGVSITEILRKGKMLNFILDDGRHLLCHLGMTGGWRITKDRCSEKHTHLELNSPSGHISYVDPRRFGHIYLYNSEQAANKLAELGEDLKSPNFTFDYFKNSLLRYPNRAIKVCLLDQSLFAGTGNYIANEICAHARVLPQRAINTLNKHEIRSLYQAVFKVIDEAVESGGTTFQGGYADTSGSKGAGVTHLVVFYQKICQICKKTEVKKIILGQRGTYYCPKCQK